jgi:hypothetical protein
MKQLSIEDRQLARKIADLLEAQHRNHASQKKLVSDFVYKGYCGEIHFAREAGLKFKFVDRPGGDGGIDYETSVTLDVKTVNLDGIKSEREALEHRHLLVKEGKARSQFYVLIGYKPDGFCHSLGWERHAKVVAVPPAVFPAIGKISNHAIKAKELERMPDLWPLLHGQSPHLGKQAQVRYQSIAEWLDEYEAKK